MNMHMYLRLYAYMDGYMDEYARVSNILCMYGWMDERMQK